MPLPMTARKSVQDHKSDIDARLAKINEATGKTYTVNPDGVEALYNAMTEDERSGKGLGYYYSEILYEFKKNMESNVKSDEMVKEGWNEKVTKPVITFKHDPTLKTSWKIDLSDGSVVIAFQKVAVNFGELSYAPFMDQL